MAEQFFKKIADDVLLAADQIQTILMNGELLNKEGGVGIGNGNSADNDFGDETGTVPDDLDLDLDLTEEEMQALIAEQLMQNNPLQGIADDVTSNIMAGQVSPQGPFEHLDAFRSAITWSEKFIIGLVCFQIFMFLTCLYISRKNSGLIPRASLLVFIAVVVRSGEWLNEQGQTHWEQFATQDYFDKRGIFISITLAGPLLLDSLMMLIIYLSEASKLLVEVKRNEFKQKKGGKKNSKTTNKKKSD